MSRDLGNEPVAIPDLAVDRQLFLACKMDGFVIAFGVKHFDAADLAEAIHAIESIRDH